MATVETLKNKNNETFYPVTKTEAVYNADGSENLSVTLTKKADISTDAGDANKMMKADGTKALVGSSNIDFTTSGFQFQSGDTYTVSSLFCSGITRHGAIDWVRVTVPSFSKTIGQGLSPTFTPADTYGVEVFGPTGVLFSESSGTAARISNMSISKSSDNTLYMSFAISSVTFTDNAVASIKLTGTFSF